MVSSIPLYLHQESSNSYYTHKSNTNSISRSISEVKNISCEEYISLADLGGDPHGPKCS